MSNGGFLHKLEGGNPGQHREFAKLPWIPVFTEMTMTGVEASRHRTSKA